MRFSEDFLCLLHLIQCQNANSGSMQPGEMKTGQDNPRTQLWAAWAESRAENKTSKVNERHVLQMIMSKCCFSGLSTQKTLVAGASRWRKSKTWRSPSSPQIHQKYIYMWNNSYRTHTERWQKTSDLPKGKKLPHIPR